MSLVQRYKFALPYGAEKVIEGKVALAEALLEAKADVNWTDKVRRIARRIDVDAVYFVNVDSIDVAAVLIFCRCGSERCPKEVLT